MKGKILLVGIFAVLIMAMVYVGYQVFGPKPTKEQCQYQCLDANKGAATPIEGVKMSDKCMYKCMGWKYTDSSSY